MTSHGARRAAVSTADERKHNPAPGGLPGDVRAERQTLRRLAQVSLAARHAAAVESVPALARAGRARRAVRALRVEGARHAGLLHREVRTSWSLVSLFVRTATLDSRLLVRLFVSTAATLDNRLLLRRGVIFFFFLAMSLREVLGQVAGDLGRLEVLHVAAVLHRDPGEAVEAPASAPGVLDQPVPPAGFFPPPDELHRVVALRR